MIMRRLNKDTDWVVIVVWYIVITIVFLCAMYDICA